MNFETIQALAQAGRHKEAIAALEQYFSSPDEHEADARALYVEEKEKQKRFFKPASPFEIPALEDEDSRSSLHARMQQGENVLDSLIQAHMMAPADKCVPCEAIRLIAKEPKTINNLFRIMVCVGDRTKDFPQGVKFADKFLEIYPKEDDVKTRVKGLRKMWSAMSVNTEDLDYRAGHGDAQAMLEKAESAAGWLRDIWLEHAAANGSEEALRLLIQEQMSRGNKELAFRLSRRLQDRSEYLLDELEYLVFHVHEYDEAEKLAWSLEDSGRWLPLIRYAAGRYHSTEGIEDLVSRLEASKKI